MKAHKTKGKEMLLNEKVRLNGLGVGSASRKVHFRNRSTMENTPAKFQE